MHHEILCVIPVFQGEAGGMVEINGLQGGPRPRASSTGEGSDAFTEATGLDSIGGFSTASEVAKRTIITAEEKSEGTVSFSVYLAHFKVSIV
jgi:hypothetical protein